MNDSVKEFLSEMITDEMITKAVREAVYCTLDRYEMSNLIEKAINDIFREKTEAYIRERVDEVFVQPVKVDNGWGDVECYDSFDEFVRKKMREKLKSDYELKREIERRLEKAIERAKKRIAERIAESDFTDEILAELGEGSK